MPEWVQRECGGEERARVQFFKTAVALYAEVCTYSINGCAWVKVIAGKEGAKVRLFKCQPKTKNSRYHVRTYVHYRSVRLGRTCCRNSWLDVFDTYDRTSEQTMAPPLTMTLVAIGKLIHRR